MSLPFSSGAQAIVQILSLDNLPVSASPGAPVFPQWLNLAKYTWFKDIYPEPEIASLRAVLDLAQLAATPLPDIEKAIASLTQWELQEVTDLVAALDLKQQRQLPQTSDFIVVDNYVRMHEARQLARRAGVAVSNAASWAQRDTEANNVQKLAAQETRQA